VQNGDSTSRHGIGGESVAVNPDALDTDKNIAGADFAMVDAQSGDLNIAIGGCEFYIVKYVFKPHFALQNHSFESCYNHFTIFLGFVQGFCKLFQWVGATGERGDIPNS